MKKILISISVIILAGCGSNTPEINQNPGDYQSETSAPMSEEEVVVKTVREEIAPPVVEQKIVTPPVKKVEEEELISESVEEKVEPVTNTVRTIKVIAKRFEFVPAVIRVKVGEKIKFDVINEDTTHNFFIEGTDYTSGDIYEAITAGTYVIRCATYCGSGHGSMTGTLIVE
jgi:cytochrome c oxidase subunit II